jgi:hypothetical protein
MSVQQEPNNKPNRSRIIPTDDADCYHHDDYHQGVTY